MVDREEHLKISDLLYAKAKELNLQEDIVSRMLSSECLLVSFDHILYLKRTHINWVRTSAQQEVNVLIEESENARNIIKTRML